LRIGCRRVFDLDAAAALPASYVGTQDYATSASLTQSIMNIRKILTALVEFAALCAMAETAGATKHTENKKIKIYQK
jgi:hypothetical protein